jgi:dihydrofolate reductase
VTKRRKIIVHIGTSEVGYIARPDGDLEWLTSRPAPEGFSGMNAFMKSIDTKVLGRKTYEESLRLGATFVLDAQAIDEFVISMAPVFIGEGIPLIAPRHRHVPLELLSNERFEDGLVQLRYRVRNEQS